MEVRKEWECGDGDGMGLVWLLTLDQSSNLFLLNIAPTLTSALLSPLYLFRLWARSHTQTDTRF
jgi:hypothetical protein